MSFLLHLFPARLASVMLLFAAACVAVASTQWVGKEKAGGIRTLGSAMATMDGERASIYANSSVVAAAPTPGKKGGQSQVFELRSMNDGSKAQSVSRSEWRGTA